MTVPQSVDRHIRYAVNNGTYTLNVRVGDPPPDKQRRANLPRHLNRS